MTIIEKFISSKTSNPEMCEDGLVITDDIIAVIDGVTSKSNNLFEGKKGGRYCKDFIVRVVDSGMYSTENAESFFTSVNNQLKEEIISKFFDIEYIEWPRASMIVYCKKLNEIWSYGDCQCMINGENFSEVKKIDELTSQMRAVNLELALLKGVSTEALRNDDVGRKAILSILKEQVYFENTDSEYGYPVINGQKINSKLIRSYNVKKGDEVILASDGYPVLRQNLAESEKELEKILKNDPMCFRMFKSTKGIENGNLSFDDRTYCRFMI